MLFRSRTGALPGGAPWATLPRPNGGDILGGYSSGQRGQTVNLLAYAYGGSNPSPPTALKSAAPCGWRALSFRGRRACRLRRPAARLRRAGILGSRACGPGWRIPRLALGIRGEGTAPAARIRAVANVFPVSLPLLAPREWAVAAGACLGGWDWRSLDRWHGGRAGNALDEGWVPTLRWTPPLGICPGPYRNRSISRRECRSRPSRSRTR